VQYHHTLHTLWGTVNIVCNTTTPSLFKVRNTCIFADGIAFACFHDVERVLSAIAEFFVQFLGKKRPKGAGEMEREE